MKLLKILFSAITIIFIALGLLKILSFDIYYPASFISLATLFLLRCIEYKYSGDKSGFFLTLATSIFVYMAAIYYIF